MDLAKKDLTIEGQSIALTNLEFNLLHTFMKNIDKALTRDFLRDEVWGSDGDGLNDTAGNVGFNRL